MVHRDISGPILRACYAACRKEATPSKILDLVLDGMAEAQQVMDMTGDMDVHNYYEGKQDAFLEVAHMIAPIKSKQESRWMALLSMERVPKENVT